MERSAIAVQARSDAKPLLILDVDGTLLYATANSNAVGRTCDFTACGYFFFRRPFLAEFLTQANAWFRLAIWTSASEDCAAEVVRHIFPNAEDLAFLWCRERCTRKHDHELRDWHWVKDLKKVKRLGYALERVLVVDDTPSCLERQRGNLITVQTFTGSQGDTELRDLLPFIETLRDVPNVRLVNKRAWRIDVTGQSRPSLPEATT